MYTHLFYSQGQGNTTETQKPQLKIAHFEFANIQYCNFDNCAHEYDRYVNFQGLDVRWKKIYDFFGKIYEHTIV